MCSKPPRAIRNWICVKEKQSSHKGKPVSHLSHAFNPSTRAVEIGVRLAGSRKEYKGVETGAQIQSEG